MSCLEHHAVIEAWNASFASSLFCSLLVDLFSLLLLVSSGWGWGGRRAYKSSLSSISWLCMGRRFPTGSYGTWAVHNAPRPMVPAHIGLRTRPRAKSSRAPREHQGGEWAKILAEIFQDLIVLMPQRCRQVINIGGAASLLSVGDGA